MIAGGLFLACALLAIVGALLAVTVRNLLHAALLLGLSLLGVAGLYLFLDQAWLACVQVIVYIGGILVLILFATLFSSDIQGVQQRPARPLLVAGVAAATLAGAVVVRLALGSRQALTARGGGGGPTNGGAGTAAIGDLLVGDWFVPFFVAGILLTMALVVAVAIVQRFRRPEREDGHA